MTSSPGTPEDRTRPHPEQRFAPPAQAFDLEATAQAISREPSNLPQKQRQKTIYRYGNSTLALFLFEAGARMEEHRAQGTVFIHVLAGRLTVQALDQRHDLPAGQVLVMAPDVPHDLYAEQDSRMLLTVCLQAGQT
jgi:quercetin dioxygenase-like cupin family protein